MKNKEIYFVNKLNEQKRKKNKQMMKLYLKSLRTKPHMITQALEKDIL